MAEHRRRARLVGRRWHRPSSSSSSSPPPRILSRIVVVPLLLVVPSSNVATTRIPDDRRRRYAIAIVVDAALADDGTYDDGEKSNDVDSAILEDMMKMYLEYDGKSTCDYNRSSSSSSSSSDGDDVANRTSFGFVYPEVEDDGGIIYNPSKWNPEYLQYERLIYQAYMSHNDAYGKRSWTIRIGTGGQMYSHYSPDMHGEAIPPQNNPQSPWVDEVQQTTTTVLYLNQNASLKQFCPSGNKDDPITCKKYYIHQAGAYQKDGNYTNSMPFYSPSIVDGRCYDNHCTFASWGTSAQVATPFTSPILYINKYVNCDDGIIEHTQMMHNFADPKDVLSTPTNVDQTYMDVGWGGVRTSSLPFALELGGNSNSNATPTTTTLKYEDVNDVDYLDLCKFGEAESGRAAVWNLNQLGGYTTFVDGRLLVNQTLPPISLPCRKPIASGGNCTLNPSTCMVGSCSAADVSNGYTRMKLRVPAGSHPRCAYDGSWKDLVVLKCAFHDVGFGRTFPTPESLTKCAPWAESGLFNSKTKTGINIAYLKHWSYFPGDEMMYFGVYSSNSSEAVNVVNSIFDNTRGIHDLAVEIRPVRRMLPGGSVRDQPITLPMVGIPSDYDPSSLDTFTFVYGDGKNFPFNSRRRVGSTEIGTKTRDYTVFTINWLGPNVKLSAGMTYVNRGYYFISDLGSVNSTAGALVDKVHAASIQQEDWSPRAIDIYTDGTKFVALAASSSMGTSTNCSGPTAALKCNGTSTPRPGHVPFFYVTCGTSRTYLGPDPYYFAPPFGSRFPGHGNVTHIVRSYVCDEKNLTIRPTWKLMGFYNPTDPMCASLKTATYDGKFCLADQTTSASPSPTFDPTNAPSPSPTATPTKGSIINVTSPSPTATPTKGSIINVTSPSPTAKPTKGSIINVTSPSPTAKPTKGSIINVTSPSPTAKPTKGGIAPNGATSTSPTATPTKDKASKSKLGKSHKNTKSRKSKRHKSTPGPTRRPSKAARERSRKHKNNQRTLLVHQ